MNKSLPFQIKIQVSSPGLSKFDRQEGQNKGEIGVKHKPQLTGELVELPTVQVFWDASMLKEKVDHKGDPVNDTRELFWK